MGKEQRFVLSQMVMLKYQLGFQWEPEEPLETESSRIAADFHSFGNLSGLWLGASVCQNIATTVLYPQANIALQLCTELWEKCYSEPMNTKFPAE